MTDVGSAGRRRFLTAAAALGAWPLTAGAKATGAAHGLRLVAAWDTPRASQVGILTIGSNARRAARIAASLDVPTRAHAIAAGADGSILVVARRPGDWLLHLRADDREQLRVLRWHWIEPDRAFNGHAIASADGRRVLTTETDLATGAGLVGVRDASTFEKLAEWSTQGRDPHELLWIAAPGGARIAVANGGITTLAETGRVKHDLSTMDPSLVLLDAASGACEGQWRLPDSRLGTRHLAARNGVIAVALQAEYGDPDARARAPVLALFDGHRLTAAPAPRALAGYGGDVVATSDGFAVSCPRAHGVAHFDARGAWQGFTPFADACALATIGDNLFIGGGSKVLRDDGTSRAQAALARPVRLDNHWAGLPGVSAS